jgi:hypothetical protein
VICPLMRHALLATPRSAWTLASVCQNRATIGMQFWRDRLGQCGHRVDGRTRRGAKRAAPSMCFRCFGRRFGDWRVYQLDVVQFAKALKTSMTPHEHMGPAHARSSRVVRLEF